jgi:hypothetical protein
MGVGVCLTYTHVKMFSLSLQGATEVKIVRALLLSKLSRLPTV